MATTRKITEERYEALINAWREFPKSPTKVAKMAGVDYRTPVKAWELGWPGRVKTRRRAATKAFDPIKEVFAREHQAARAAILANQAVKKATLIREREAAIEQAAKVRAQEGQMVGLARGTALQALTTTAMLAASARKLGKVIAAKLDALTEDKAHDPASCTLGKGATPHTCSCPMAASSISPSAGLEMLNRVADLMNKINAASRTSMELERLHLGQPTQTINVITTQTEMTIDEVAARIESANRALMSARRAGGLSVIDGGLSKPRIGKLVTPADVAVSRADVDGGVDTKANIQS